MSAPTPAFSSLDHQHMLTALGLAEQALFITSPNPRVGCVLVNPAGQVIGQGHTQAAGQAHAEVMALKDAVSQGASTQGATAYVTLEPCSHQGRTPPCCEALVQAGIQRVVMALQDPNPLVLGRGQAYLQAAGVLVDIGLLGDAAAEINRGFIHRMQIGRPWVRLKVAASLDGITALEDGQSQWITSPSARQDGHRWRARSCAVLTGIGTVLEDNPRLDVRDVPTPRQPTLVVVDSRLQTPPTARLFEPQRPVWLAHALSDEPLELGLRALGTDLMHLPNPNQKIDLPRLLQTLAQRGINELHVEAGHKLNTSLLREDLVDELLVYLAPSLLGQGRGFTSLGPIENLTQSLRWHFFDSQAVGPDWRFLLRKA